jgi:hypothetical protein
MLTFRLRLLSYLFFSFLLEERSRLLSLQNCPSLSHALISLEPCQFANLDTVLQKQWHWLID